jgi:threonine dehydrogenase-like Zn-dependent dehydrogenase
MRALVYDGALRVSDVPVPRSEDEALIRVRIAGICSTDLEITRGYGRYLGVLGHEFVGDVVESPDPTWLGRRVCGEINVRCGKCRWCKQGMGPHCERRTVLGIRSRSGAFAEFLSLPVENLHGVVDTVTDDQAVFVEPLAAAFEILEQVQVRPEDRVTVLGDGKLGFLCAMVLQATGASVELAGKHESKLARARALGLTSTHVERIVASSADIVVEASGSASGLEVASQIARPRGTVVLKTTVARASPIDMSPIVVKELTVVGSRCGPFDRAIEALESGWIAVDSLIDARFPLERGVEAVKRAASPGTMKVLIDIWEP